MNMYIYVFFVKTPTNLLFIDNINNKYPEMVKEGRFNNNVLRKSTIHWSDEINNIPQIDDNYNIIHDNGEYYCIVPEKYDQHYPSNTMDFNNSIAYNLGDYVIYNNIPYKSLIDNNQSLPSSNHLEWMSLIGFDTFKSIGGLNNFTEGVDYFTYTNVAEIKSVFHINTKYVPSLN